MGLFHIASNKNAEAILKEGFRNRTGYYLTDRLWEGVWISDKPFNDEHLSDTDTLFAIEIPSESCLVLLVRFLVESGIKRFVLCLVNKKSPKISSERL